MELCTLEREESGGVLELVYRKAWFIFRFFLGIAVVVFVRSEEGRDALLHELTHALVVLFAVLLDQLIGRSSYGNAATRLLFGHRETSTPVCNEQLPVILLCFLQQPFYCGSYYRGGQGKTQRVKSVKGLLSRCCESMPFAVEILEITTPPRVRLVEQYQGFTQIIHKFVHTLLTTRGIHP